MFKKDTGYEKTEIIKIRKTQYTAERPTGWLAEQSGYPLLACGFAHGFFYIKANSNRKWMSDKTDRWNVNPAKAAIMQPVSPRYKSSVIAYKIPFGQFPKDCWITFDVETQWNTYGKENENILKKEESDVRMTYTDKKEKVIRNYIIAHESLFMGCNDEAGYYFKFGIYRVGNSTEPVLYNLAGFTITE